jgi:hypothetical protein
MNRAEPHPKEVTAGGWKFLMSTPGPCDVNGGASVDEQGYSMK